MSSAASNRYQSRLFNFVYKRSRSLTKHLNRAWQNVTSWIAPVVMHPAQVLHAAVHNSLPQLPKVEKLDSPPPVDTPVKNVLLLVEVAESVEELSLNRSQPAIAPTNPLRWLVNKFAKTKATSLSKSEQVFAPTPLSRSLVGGIASDIANRTLVLVSPHNEILDILNSQQQQRLQARIVDEVAQYWRYQSLLASSAETTRSLLPAPPSFLSAPARLFSNIVTWVHAGGKLSKSSNLPTDDIDERGELIFATQQAIAFLDRNIAQFETNHLAAVANNPTKTNKFQIQALIWAAIDYFFGDRSLEKLPAKDRNQQLCPKATNFSLEDITDPWLTIGDLFGEPKPVIQPVIKQNYLSSKFEQLPDNSNLTAINKSALQNLLNRCRQIPQTPAPIATIPQTPKKLVKVKPQKTFTPVVAQLSDIAKQSKKSKADKLTANLRTSVASTADNQINYTPDWIETEATTMGYIKHPLEQLLAWLDAAMLWLEDILVRIWQRLQKLLIVK